MRYEARITAYDMLDSVCVAVVVWDTDADEAVLSAPVVTRTTTVRGTGESDPLRWTTDALVAALETL
jgi:hypothetical protein